MAEYEGEEVAEGVVASVVAFVGVLGFVEVGFIYAVGGYVAVAYIFDGGCGPVLLVVDGVELFFFGGYDADVAAAAVGYYAGYGVVVVLFESGGVVVGPGCSSHILHGPELDNVGCYG